MSMASGKGETIQQQEAFPLLKILLVDDESTERKGLRFLIGKYQLPLEVSEAANGRAALDFLRAHPVDILLTDVKMPLMDGLELAREARALSERLKIIIYSAYSEFDYARQAMEAKAINYLLKPIEVDEFQKVMSGVIQMCREEAKQEAENRALRESFEKMRRYDREQLLSQLVTAPEIGGDYARALAEHEIQFQNKTLLLIGMETRTNFFDKHEEAVTAALGQALSTPFEYVNLSPGSSYVILCGKSAPEEEALHRALETVRSRLRACEKAEISIVVGSAFGSLEQFPEMIQEIETVRYELFYGADEILFTERLRQIRDRGNEATAHIVERVNAAIENRDLGETRRQISLLTETLEKQAALSAVYTRYLFWDVVNRLYKRFQVMNDASIRNKVEALLRCESVEKLQGLMDEVLCELETHPAQASLDASDVVSAAIRVIQTEYQQDLSLEYLAQRVYLAPAYLSYLFKQQTGENIIKYITSFRMEKACRMLEDNNMKVVDVSRACGYDSPSYFNRLFKNSCGMTPKQYREKKHEEG